MADRQTDDLAIYVAWLSYIGGYTQAEIANRLSLSRAKVHRLIGEAHQAGYVHVYIDRAPKLLVSYEDRIAERFGLAQCLVVPDVGDPGDRQGNVVALGSAAARYVHGRIVGGDVAALGVSWGRSLAEMTRQLPREAHPGLAVVSLMGSLTQQSAVNPFDVVYRLADKTGGQGFFLPVPFIADSIEDRRVLMAQRSVADALNRARRIDLGVVGIGAMALDQPMFMEERGLLGERQLAELIEAGAVGELVGHFLDRHGQPVPMAINERTIGLSLAELAEREIIAVTGGADKGPAIQAVLSSGVIDRLILDEPAAEALLRMKTRAA
ncbi:sugar-binding transcriptional regulator [Salinisphaera sp.]|uniref:sugar-binding transcriptional regulator n=1 Tax=Salinisphaera sp. TaxID=1914330 RepID=UPI002D790692|nr:sugar-binding transcriptional regulator [Salinisphaera sp.]HET7315275.1 sugar-binding transcriptional regulator [Salinisphaera sp.]